MKDERIQTTANRLAAAGFFIWYFLLSISLCYRTLILKQHPSQWWDIFAIWVIGVFFTFIAYARKGVFDHGFNLKFLKMGIINLILIPVVLFMMGAIHSISDAAGVFFIALLGTGSVIAIAYFLNHRWKRKEGIDEEK